MRLTIGKRFDTSELGSLWYYTTFENNTGQTATLITHDTQDANFFPILQYAPVIKLSEKQKRGNAYMNLVLAPINTGEMKVGWVFDDEASWFIPYEKILNNFTYTDL